MEQSFKANEILKHFQDHKNKPKGNLALPIFYGFIIPPIPNTPKQRNIPDFLASILVERWVMSCRP